MLLLMLSVPAGFTGFCRQEGLRVATGSDDNQLLVLSILLRAAILQSRLKMQGEFPLIICKADSRMAEKREC